MGLPPVFRIAAYRRLWAATGVSLVGSQVTLLALPLTAVVSLHAGAAEVALLSAAGTAPFLLFGLPAGVWVERWPLRRLMVTADLGRALLLASVPLAWALGSLGLAQLAIVAFAVGALGVLFDVASLSVLPAMVPGGRLAEANSAIEVVRAGAQTSGPALAGGLVHLVTAPFAVLADAVSYLLSACLLRGLTAVGRVRAGEPRGPLTREVRAGLAFCLRHRYIRPLAGGAAWINFWTEAVLAVFLTYAVRDLGLSAATIGLVLALSNLGYLAGSLLVPWLNRHVGVGRTIVVGAALHGGLLLAALAPGDARLPWLVTGFALFALGGALWNVNAVSLRQATTPPGMMARMNAANRFLIWGTMPLGAAGGGLLAAHLGLGAAVTVAASALPVCVLPLARSSVARVAAMPGDGGDAGSAAPEAEAEGLLSQPMRSPSP